MTNEDLSKSDAAAVKAPVRAKAQFSDYLIFISIDVIAVGIGMIYLPAGVIAFGIGHLLCGIRLSIVGVRL